ncbi:MAG: lyase heat domain protein repeat-containing protein [Actinomycetia bacterium]|nr:lyase heat domain protein repeat-containing protein [Actinomycetes bacterium]
MMPPAPSTGTSASAPGAPRHTGRSYGLASTTGVPSQAAATALGRIGPAAREAAPDLRRHALAGSHDAAWALGRVTGDIREAVTTLIGMIRLPAGNHVLRYLADFGTEAAEAEEWLAESLSPNPGDWRQVEAAHAWWRITGDAGTAISALAQAARPLAEGACILVRLRGDRGATSNRLVRAVA